VKYVLGRTPGPVAVNLSTTQAIDDLAAEAGVPVFRTKIGESNVVEEMLARKAVIGGEGNGGVVWPAVHHCRDSFAAAGLILQMMAETGKSVSKLRSQVPAYVMVKEKLTGTPEQAHRMLGQLRKIYAAEEISTLDGLLIRAGGARVHVRPSNTEPIIRVQAEARTRREAARALGRVKRQLAALLK
jgi:phosphomannomutase